MPKITRQTIRSRGVNYLKVVLLLVGTVFLMNGSITLLTPFNPILSSIIGIVIVGVGVAIIYNIVIYDMANYIYKIIGRELIIERIISKNNHVFYNIGFKDILIFERFNGMSQKVKIPKSMRFVQTKDKESWYYLAYNRKGQQRQLVFEPEMGLVKTISERLKDNEIH